MTMDTHKWKDSHGVAGDIFIQTSRDMSEVLTKRQYTIDQRDRYNHENRHERD